MTGRVQGLGYKLNISIHPTAFEAGFCQAVGLGAGVWIIFRFLGFVLRVWGFETRDQDLGFRVSGLGFRVSG